MGDLSRLNNLNYGDDLDDYEEDYDLDDYEEDYDPDYDEDGISRDTDPEEKRRIKNFLRDTETQENLRKIGIMDRERQLEMYLKHHHHDEDVKVPKMTVADAKMLQKAGIDISDTKKVADIFYRVKTRAGAQFNDQYADRSRFKKESE